jgi:ectoine hydroxylase-related dioxygenase (phytanoyl-CoA dioxygenase family)
LPAKIDETFRHVADHPHLQGAMAQLLGGPVKRFTDQALIKSKEIDGNSYYHQDSYYWHLKPELGCNSWIALDEVGKDAIALAVLPGTHKSWTLTPHEPYFDEPTYHSAAKNNVAFQRHRIPLSEIDFSKEVLLPMSPGDAAFFTNFTWHRSERNRSGQHKCAYAIAYQREDRQE